MLYRFSHKTGTYGVTIKEDSDHQVLVQIEQVILVKLKVFFFMKDVL